MKFNFVQKKGVVVALAAALAVGSFGITALAGITFAPATDAQSAYFQSNQSVALAPVADAATLRITLTPGTGSDEAELNVEGYYKGSQSVLYTIDKRQGGATTITYDPATFKVKADGNGTAIFDLKVDSIVLRTWTVTASGWSTGGSSSSGGTGGGGGAATTKPEKEPEKGSETTTTSTTPTISKGADGSMKLVDADGKAVVNAKVTIDGKSYLSDADGKVITNAIATTPKGNKVFCGADGAIVKNKTVTVAGKKYLASKTGKIVTNKVAKTPKGNLVYCTKSGAIKTNGIFKVDGKKYIAKKSGALYTNRWVTIGKTKYFCNKSGVVTKTKAVSTTKK